MVEGKPLQSARRMALEAGFLHGSYGAKTPSGTKRQTPEPSSERGWLNS